MAQRRRYNQAPTPGGYNRSEVTSALQKAIRRGEEEQALYWAQELFDAGSGDYLWKRLLIITSEDIGLAWPEGPAVIRALYQNYLDGMRRAKANGTIFGSGVPLFTTHAVLLLCRSPKSRIVDHAVLVTRRSGLRYDIPDEALDRHTRRGKMMGRGVEHFFEEATKLDNETLADEYRDRAYQLAMEGDGSLFTNSVNNSLFSDSEDES
jgi:replication-associated recombination protein RarA